MTTILIDRKKIPVVLTPAELSYHAWLPRYRHVTVFVTDGAVGVGVGIGYSWSLMSCLMMERSYQHYLDLLFCPLLLSVWEIISSLETILFGAPGNNIWCLWKLYLVCLKTILFGVLSDDVTILST